MLRPSPHPSAGTEAHRPPSRCLVAAGRSGPFLGIRRGHRTARRRPPPPPRDAEAPSGLRSGAIPSFPRGVARRRETCGVPRGPGKGRVMPLAGVVARGTALREGRKWSVRVSKCAHTSPMCARTSRMCACTLRLGACTLRLGARTLARCLSTFALGAHTLPMCALPAPMCLHQLARCLSTFAMCLSTFAMCAHTLAMCARTSGRASAPPARRGDPGSVSGETPATSFPPERCRGRRPRRRGSPAYVASCLLLRLAPTCGTPCRGYGGCLRCRGYGPLRRSASLQSSASARWLWWRS